MNSTQGSSDTQTYRAYRYNHFLIHGIVLIAILMLSIFQPLSGDWLSLDQSKVKIGHEWWRLITGHLVHLSWNHTLLNCAGLTLIAVIFTPTTGSSIPSIATSKMVIIFYLLSSIITSVCLLTFEPNIQNYFGLSGLLYGLIIFYFICDIKENTIFSIAALIMIISKIFWDQIHSGNDHLTAELIGGPVAASAHLYGGIGGFISALAALYCSRSKRSRAP